MSRERGGVHGARPSDPPPARRGRWPPQAVGGGSSAFHRARSMQRIPKEPPPSRLRRATAGASHGSRPSFEPPGKPVEESRGCPLPHPPGSNHAVRSSSRVHPLPRAWFRRKTPAMIDLEKPFLGISHSVLGQVWRDRLDARARNLSLAMAQTEELPEIVARVLTGRGVMRGLGGGAVLAPGRAVARRADQLSRP